MKIKIEKTEKFAEKVTKEIKAVEGKARERLLTPDMIIEIVESVEKNLGIAKKNLDGVEIDYTGAQTFPNAYKYRPESTHFTARRIGSAWYVTSVGRYTCPNRNSNTSVKLTDVAKKAICEKHETLCL